MTSLFYYYKREILGLCLSSLVLINISNTKGEDNMGIKVNGKIIVENYRNEIKSVISEGVIKGLRVPSIKTILVGDDGGSLSYVKSQNNLCDKLGVSYSCIHLDRDVEAKGYYRYYRKIQ